MRLHEVLEILGYVLTAPMLVHHGVEISEHVLECLLALRRSRGAHRSRQVLELLIEYVTLQHVADLVVRRSRLRRTPVVIGEFTHRARRVIGEHVEHGFAEARVIGWIGEECGALCFEGFVKFVSHLLKKAIEAPGLLQLTSALLQPPAQVVEPASAIGTSAQEITQGIAHR